MFDEGNLAIFDLGLFWSGLTSQLGAGLMTGIFKRLVAIKRKLSFEMGTFFARLHGAEIGKKTKIDIGAKIINSRHGTIKIGDKCLVHHGVIFSPHKGGSITVGSNCSINPYCILYGHGGLHIGDRVRIAAHAVFIPANHRFKYVDGSIQHQGLTRLGISIGNDVWIGAGVRILDGVSISSNIIIGAGSVVTKSLQKPGVYAGVPARFIKSH